MPYLDEFGLSTYDSNLKEWISSQESKTLTSSIYPWTKTAKAGAVSCWPVGGTPLLPTVDFMFTETGPASGEKGPENPSTIAGVSSVAFVRESSNIASVPRNKTVNFPDGVTFASNSEGAITITGTPTANRHTQGTSLSTLFAVNVPPGRYTLSAGVDTHKSYIFAQIIKANGSSFFPAVTTDVRSTSFYINDGDVLHDIRVQANKDQSYDETVFPCLSLYGTGEDISASETTDVSLGSTYYGGTIDLATGVMTVTWAGDVLSASNLSTVGVSQSVVTNMVFITSKAHGGGSATSPAVLTCNRFPTVSGSGNTEHCRFSGAGSGTALNIYIDRSRLDLSGAVDPANPTAAELKAAMIAWLSANQTSVVYQLSEPYTVQFTPAEILSLTQADKYTPRLNTIYTDASSVQVGYVKSPIREEYELTQAIVSQGGNI